MSPENSSSEEASGVTVLRLLPAVSELMSAEPLPQWIETAGRASVVAAIRVALQDLRSQISAGALQADRAQLMALAVAAVQIRLDETRSQSLGKVINATGIILHTGLGRAPLSPQAVKAVETAAGYCNLEIDLTSGERRTRGYQVESLWERLTGAEASLMVNNNAAATLLTLQALCAGREVIISRGQLIEIGGSFRLPDILTLGGCTLREVGTTNRTRLADYAAAIGPQTAAILRVHPSNYRVVGFTETPEIDELVGLGRPRGILVMDDIGSGSLLDVTRWGLPAEPTFGGSLAAGADLVLGSGDKLLGGPQCGIILGRKELIDQLKRHPLARAVRIDKLTLAALAATLELYDKGSAEVELPVWQMLSATALQLRQRAETIVSAVRTPELACHIDEGFSEVGGGSLPAVELPTVMVSLDHAALSADELARRLRIGHPRLFGRIQSNSVQLDLRSVTPADDAGVIAALRNIV